MAMDRRGFIRSLGMGVVATPVIYAGAVIAQSATAAAGFETGNSNQESRLRSECGPQPTDGCRADYMTSRRRIFSSVVAAPVYEEALFRYVPSRLADQDERKQRMAADRRGKQVNESSLRRRAMLIGAASTLLFGAMHNRQPDGSFDTTTIPAGQLAAGAGLWQLQRTVGLPANIAAHAGVNAVGTLLAAFSRPR